MYDTSLQHGFRSFAARNKIHHYGNYLFMHCHLPVRPRGVRPHRGRQ